MLLFIILKGCTTALLNEVLLPLWWFSILIDLWLFTLLALGLLPPPWSLPFPCPLCPLQDLASSLKVPFLETSAKSSDNVERAFLTMASEIHKRVASEGGGMQSESKETRAQSAKINSAPLWLGGDKQTPEASNCCWARDTADGLRTISFCASDTHLLSGYWHLCY